MKVCEYLRVSVGRAKQNSTVAIEDKETGEQITVFLKDVKALEQTLRKARKQMEKLNVV